MHTRVIVAVPAEQDDAAHAADVADESASDWNWSDWHEVGGRWENSLADKSVISLSENRALVISVLGEIVALQRYNLGAELEQLRMAIADQDSAVSMTLATVNGETVKRFHREDAGYQLVKLGEKLMGSFTDKSGFYDVETGDPSPVELLNQIEAGTLEGDLCLVVIDAHY